MYFVVKHKRSGEKGICDEREAWTRIFDPITPFKEKVELKNAMRYEIDYRARQERESMHLHGHLAGGFGSEKHLPDGIISAFVMAGAYQNGMNIYAALNATSKSKNFIMIGYSSGLHSNDKRFSDGTNMSRAIFIPEKDLDALKSNPGAPLLFIEDVVDTRITLVAIAKALRNQLGYRGEFYETYGTGYHPFRCELNSFVISTGELSKAQAAELTERVPILTEYDIVSNHPKRLMQTLRADSRQSDL